MSAAAIRVALVDDHRLVRVGIASALTAAGDVEVVAEAADGSEALAVLGTTEVDVVLMDLSMPVMDGVDATRRLLARDPAARVVVLSSFADSSRVRDAIGAGAVGYVLKDCTPEDLIAAVRAAAAGHALGRYSYQANGKALAMGESSGMVKTIFDAKTGELLGAHIIGAEATEMISTFVLGRSMEAVEEDFFHACLPHPTLSEMIAESVLASEGRALNG